MTWTRSSQAAACLLCLWIALLGFDSLAAETVVKADSRIEVIYFSAPDCPPCKSWRHMRSGDWMRFAETDAARAVTLVTIEKQSLRTYITRDHYPKELAGLFEKASQFGNTLPAWWVLVDGVPTIRRAGEANWKTGIEPALVQIVEAKRKGGGVGLDFSVKVEKPSFIPNDIADVEQVPYISSRAKESYRRFLGLRGSRAFALSPDGSHAWWQGGSNPSKSALDVCDANTTDYPCRLYVVDQKVVWREE